MLQAIGRAFGLMVGFFFWGLILLMVAALVLGSLWLDASGVEQPALVAAKYERITFTHADWTRTLEIGLQREASPMAGPPDLVGVERVRVAAAEYDGLRTGQTVKVRVQPPGFFKDRISRVPGQPNLREDAPLLKESGRLHAHCHGLAGPQAVIVGRGNADPLH